MLRTLVVAFTIAGLMAGSSLAGVLGSDHDLSATNDNDELCLPCHTPHSGDTTIGLLWNHAYQADAAFTKFTDDAELGLESLTCLSCHDGQTGVDNYGGGNNTDGAMTGAAAIGTDLSDDHPVGVEYPWVEGGHNRFEPKGTIWGGHVAVNGTNGNALPLFTHTNGKDQIECATCHTPHESGDSGNFLRVENTGSALCITCHDGWAN